MLRVERTHPTSTSGEGVSFVTACRERPCLSLISIHGNPERSSDVGGSLTAYPTITIGPCEAASRGDRCSHDEEGGTGLSKPNSAIMVASVSYRYVFALGLNTCGRMLEIVILQSNPLYGMLVEH